MNKVRVPRGPYYVRHDGSGRDLLVPAKYGECPIGGGNIMAFSGDAAVIIGRMLRAEWREGYRAALRAATRAEKRGRKG